MSSKNLPALTYGHHHHHHHGVPTVSNKEYEMRENSYSNNVLVGNWYEERFADKTDKKAITPAIYGRSGCLLAQSLQRSDYTQPDTTDKEEDKVLEQYRQWKMAGRHNRENGEETNIRLWDGHQYDKNITTMQDLMFRIVPEKRKHELEEEVDDILKKPTKEDFMLSYGNRTTTGLLNWRACEKWRDQNTALDVSHYKNVFKRLPIVKLQRCRGPQEKTSIF